MALDDGGDRPAALERVEKLARNLLDVHGSMGLNR
jgi:hypothetical protein